MMHAAALTSPRLQRVLALLSDGQPHSTRDIVRRAKVMAVSACVAELRTHGAEIICSKQAAPSGEVCVFYYPMTKAPVT